MKKYINKIIIIMLFSIIFLAIFTIKTHATASISISPSAGEVEPNKPFTITVRVSGGAGYVNLSASNATISKTNIWLDNSSETISCVAGGTNGANISIKASGVIASYDTGEDENKSASTRVKINKKEEKPTTPAQTTPTTPTTQKPTTTTKKPTTTTQTKQEEPKKEVVEDNFYINSVLLKGIKENGETEDIVLSPEFNKDTYEYTCNVSAQITKIEIQKEAGQYTNSIIVTGGEELKIGENIITLMLSAEDHQAKTYTIKVIKEEAVETSANIAEEKIEEDKPQKEPAMIHMPVWAFIALQMGIIVVEVLTILFVIKRRKGQH